MKKLLAFFLCAIAVGFNPTFAQEVTPMPSSAIYEQLEQLGKMGTVMYFAAHPDDDNTRLLAYLVHHDHVRTIYYALTRGDGGQNILGDEQGAALGLIRTYELLQSRKIDGAQQMFSPFVDFGYTVSLPETFKFWNKQKLIQDAVKAIQQTHPDMIICRFPTTGEGIHAQHTASAIVAKDAWLFIKKYNDTTSGKKLWLPTRVLFNAFHFGSHSTIKPGQFKLRIGQYDPLLGEGLGVLAGKSRSENKSQGAGTPQVAGTSVEHFEVVEGQPLQNSFYEDIDTTWGRIGHPEIGQAIKKVISHFDFTHPAKGLPALVAINKAISKLPENKVGFWKARKLRQVHHIILSCAGIMSDALVKVPQSTPGTKLSGSFQIITRGHVKLKSVKFKGENLISLKQGVALSSDSLYHFAFSVRLAKNQPVTQPYWMKVPPIHDEYQFPAKYLGMPVAPNKLAVQVTVEIEGESFELSVPISHKKLDPVRGQVVQRLRIVPPISVEPTKKLFVYTPGKNAQVVLHIKTYDDIKTAQLTAKGHIVLQKMALNHLPKGTDTFVTITIPKEKLAEDKNANYVAFSVRFRNKNYHKAVHLINYSHIPELQYLTEAKMKKVPKDWKVAVHRVGYVEGVGDYVDDILRLCGLKVEQIPLNELNNEHYLKRYDAIVVGIRAFNTQKKLKAGISGLLNYVHSGGTLIVQYNKSFHLVTNKLGPYPITLSRNRVTDENAPVKITNPGSPLLYFPNKITSNDFKGWVQERGLYAAGKWDKRHYQTLFSIRGIGSHVRKTFFTEKEINSRPFVNSSVLYTKYGRGHYIYTSLAFFRQLPAGNVGAIRLFMNFLSAGKRER